MLAAHHIHKSFGIETVLKDISFNLSPGERLGLVGPNGSGKTTLLRILAGLEPPDSGSAQISPPGLSLGYLAQGFTFPAGETLESFLRRMEGDLPALTARIEQLAGDLATTPARGDLQQEYDQVLQRMQTVSESAGNGPAVLAALGLGHILLETPVDHLSGGQKTRLALAGVLLANPQVLLLDEPTNHLDLEMLAWLEDWLTTFPERKNSAALVVSHDRAFLDRIATGILEIDLQNHTLKAYSGNYTAYLEEKLAERERQWQSYSDQQDEISRLRSAAERVRGNAAFKRGGKGDSGDKFAKGF
ncbi:MAG TPA: ATP-binding cassette domain-containing protein, partial [Anaerolineales bacterium]